MTCLPSAYSGHIAAMLGSVGLTGMVMSLSPNAAIASTASALTACARIAAPDSRLACYDSLAGRPSSSPAPALASTPMNPGIAGSAPSSAAPAPLPTDDPRNFGLTPSQLHMAPQGPEAIEAKIARIGEDQQGTVTVVLDNGQRWKFLEDARLGPSPGDAVTIRRAALGSFMMMTPSKRTYRVHRLQ